MTARRLRRKRCGLAPVSQPPEPSRARKLCEMLMSQENETVADRARKVAHRMQRLIDDIRETFKSSNPVDRMRMMQNIGSEILIELTPVFGWLERRRPPDKIQLLMSRLDCIMSEAVSCAGLNIPEYAGGEFSPVGKDGSEGLMRTVSLVVPLSLFGANLVDWANDIEEEEGQSSPESGNRIQLVGDMWQIRYESETGNYPVRGNQCIAWLAKIVESPNRQISVADLRGDPEGKLAADRGIPSETETDIEGIEAIRDRLQEIDDILTETGENEKLENERHDLLARLKTSKYGKKLQSGLANEHRNMATQIRKFLKNKLIKTMPKFTGHLKTSLKLNFPCFGYYPPTATPPWKI